MKEQAVSKVPKIRFKGHSETWRTESVSLLLTERNVQAPKSELYPLMAFIAGQGVAQKGKRYNREFLVSDELNKKYKQTELGDFIYSSNNLETGSIGTNNYGSASISPVYSIFSPTIEGDSSFIGQLLCKKAFINEMVKWRQGVVYGQWRIHESDFLKIKATFPTVDEQTQIGGYFRELDRLIGLHQRKHDKLVTLKKAMLQKMFPQPGATTPEIRFKGFSGEWVEKKIHELFQVTRGNVLAATKTSTKQTKEAPYPVYSSQTKNNGLMGYYKSYLFEDAITWTTDGANAGTVCYREGKFYSTNVNGVLLSDRGYANRAVSESLNQEAWKHVSHVGNPKLMNNVMSQIKIFVPDTIAEQQKIGTYFRTFDSLISKHATQLQKLQQIKSACLEKMFV